MTNEEKVREIINISNTNKENKMELQCRHNANKVCQYCHGVTAQDGWRFAGCDYLPYQGKWVAEIKECPKTVNKKLNGRL